MEGEISQSQKIPMTRLHFLEGHRVVELTEIENNPQPGGCEWEAVG